MSHLEATSGPPAKEPVSTSSIVTSLQRHRLWLIYDLPVPARASSLIPTDGILLKRLLLVEDADLAELGDEV